MIGQFRSDRKRSGRERQGQDRERSSSRDSNSGRPSAMFLEQQIRMISEGSCDAEDRSNGR